MTTSIRKVTTVHDDEDKNKNKIKLRTKVKIGTKTKTESKIAPKTTKAESKTTTITYTSSKADSETGTKADSKIGSKTRTKTGTKDESKIDTKADSITDAKADSKIGTKADSKTDSKTRTKTYMKAESKIDTKADSLIGTKVDTKTKTKTKLEETEITSKRIETNKKDDVEIKNIMEHNMISKISEDKIEEDHLKQTDLQIEIIAGKGEIKTKESDNSIDNVNFMDTRKASHDQKYDSTFNKEVDKSINQYDKDENEVQIKNVDVVQIDRGEEGLIQFEHTPIKEFLNEQGESKKSDNTLELRTIKENENKEILDDIFDVDQDDDLGRVINRKKSLNKGTDSALSQHQLESEGVDQRFLKPLQSPLSKMLLSSSGSTFIRPPSPYPHSTTIFLIIFLHLLFYIQWKKRTIKQQIEFSYNAVIVRRRYHLTYWSFLSHVPTTNERRSTNEHNDDDVSSSFMSNLPTTTSSEANTVNPLSWRYRIRIFFVRFVNRSRTKIKTVSTLPQLTYISHVLWQIRSLEEYVYRYGLSYPKLIFIAMTTCIACKLMITGMFMSSVGLRRQLSPSIRIQVHQNRIHQNMNDIHNFLSSSTFTPIITSLLVIYSNLLPNVPIQILPFIPFLQLPVGELGFLMCMFFLTSGCTFETTARDVIARKNLQLWNVWTGVINGAFITWKIDFFMVYGSYWVSCVFCISLSLCALSLWVEQQPQQNQQHPHDTGRANRGEGLRIPCVDYVGWDEDGVIREEKESERIWIDGLTRVEEESNLVANLRETVVESNENFGTFAQVEGNSILDDENAEMGEEDNFLSWNNNDVLNNQETDLSILRDRDGGSGMGRRSRRITRPTG